MLTLLLQPLAVPKSLCLSTRDQSVCLLWDHRITPVRRELGRFLVPTAAASRPALGSDQDTQAGREPTQPWVAHAPAHLYSWGEVSRCQALTFLPYPTEKSPAPDPQQPRVGTGVLLGAPGPVPSPGTAGPHPLASPHRAPAPTTSGPSSEPALIH